MVYFTGAVAQLLQNNLKFYHLVVLPPIVDYGTTVFTADEIQFNTVLIARLCFVLLGPRMVLNPIRIFKGSFVGETLFQNQHYQPPNEVRTPLFCIVLMIATFCQ